MKLWPENTVGLVEPQRVQFPEPLRLQCGRTIDQHEVVYETYGALNEKRDNAVLICHALSGDHHAAGYHSAADKRPGWWDSAIGPGKPIDTDRFFVVSPNNIGGCAGSSGPNCINPATGKYWGPDFPIVTVKDWVQSQALLADHLGIQRWAVVAGGSLGGMQALQWAIDLPERIANALVIAAAPRLSAQNIAFNEVARKAIMSDPGFSEGHYQSAGTVPKHGLMLARMLGHITYLSDDLMRSKFGRDLREGKINFGFDVEFEIESYLRHQGETFVDRFDANSYLLMTKTLDYFDPAADFGGDFNKAVSGVLANFLVVSFSSDWRFSPERSREIVYALRRNSASVAYAEIESPDGHDAFLLENPDYMAVLHAFLDRAYQQLGTG